MITKIKDENMFVLRKIVKNRVVLFACSILMCIGTLCPCYQVNAVTILRQQTGENAQVDIKSPSAILIEAESGQVLFEKNCDTAMAPASVTKIMTLLLTFEALDKGDFSLEDKVVVSKHAASMGGSQCFFEDGEGIC